jgi:hypothetical protein
MEAVESEDLFLHVQLELGDMFFDERTLLDLANLDIGEIRTLVHFAVRRLTVHCGLRSGSHITATATVLVRMAVTKGSSSTTA